jgi:hypothetical protein
MEQGDVYQSKVLFALQFGEEAVLNLYHQAQSTDAAADAGDVFTGLNAAIIADFLGVLNENLTVSGVQIINGMDNDDYFETFVSQSGTRTGTQLPLGLATGFRSDRSGPGYRYTHHALPFGSQSDLAGNAGRWATAFQAELDVIAEILGDSFNATGPVDMVPVQLTGGFKFGVTPVVKQVIDGLWSYNRWPTFVRTRQLYDWVEQSP